MTIRPLTDFGLIGNLTLTVIPMISASGRSSHSQRSTNTATTIGTVPTVPHWFVQHIWRRVRREII
ncbi:MAG: hypothetical protein EBT47_08070 [Chloroflexi bacterium]|nr:hypothetical protein [Chloroflexota bacterium]